MSRTKKAGIFFAVMAILMIVLGVNDRDAEFLTTGIGIEVLGNIIMLLIFLGMLILPFAIPIYKKTQEKKKIEQAYLQECEEQARLEKIANKKISILKENINIVTKVYNKFVS